MDILWVCRSSLKIATKFSPFSLVYGTEAVSLVELAIPTPRIVLEEILGYLEDMHTKDIVMDGLGKPREKEGADKKAKSKVSTKNG